MSRERLAWRKLAAQGFSTLPDFFRQKAEKEQQEARLAALVAAHSAQRSVQPKQYILEEEEETESDSGPDTGSSSCMPASGVHIPSDSETCQKASPKYLEESEESEDSSSSSVQEQLVVMARDKKLGPTLCSRVQAMVGILNLFLDRDLGYTWRQASLVVAKSQAWRTRTWGNNVTCVQLIRHWVLHFIQTQELPHHKYSRTHSIILEDEDVSQEIRSELEGKMKSWDGGMGNGKACKICWDREGSSKTPGPKGDGQSLMVSDFLSVDWGCLHDDNSEVHVFFKAGKL
ncbi:hypothetical protein EDB92DRAFT_1821065 [Lactarius akahatsu]|uniref:Uncharacterized protein n=1 Tax=Lactarius akahatsu TaxID=416441 RepID=A0AAD4L715_9AGAM|nr:hypothetical protein EDB92DRAFT_1821065 [Lactarius akahatsu]